MDMYICIYIYYIYIQNMIMERICIYIYHGQLISIALIRVHVCICFPIRS